MKTQQVDARKTSPSINERAIKVVWFCHKVVLPKRIRRAKVRKNVAMKASLELIVKHLERVEYPKFMLDYGRLKKQLKWKKQERETSKLWEKVSVVQKEISWESLFKKWAEQETSTKSEDSAKIAPIEENNESSWQKEPVSTPYFSAEEGYETSSYGSAKDYYSLIMDSQDVPKGGSLFEHYEHQMLEKVQDAYKEIRKTADEGRPQVEAFIDWRMREKINQIKMYNMTLSFIMYEGKITFN